MPYSNRLWSRFLAILALATMVMILPFGAKAAGEPVQITVVMPLTGSAAAVGQSDATALRILEDIVNKSGGIAGRPFKFVIQDDQSSPQIAVQLASVLVSNKAPVILGSGTTAACAAMAPLMKNGPVDLCFSPGIHPDKGSFVFSPAPADIDLAIVTARYAKKQGWHKLALIASTDSSGSEGEKAIREAFASPEFQSVSLVDVEHFAVSDISVTAQVLKMKAAGPDAIYIWATGAPSSTVIRGIQSAGLDIPILTSYSNATAAQIATYKGYTPKVLLFPGLPAMLLAEELPRGKVRDQVAGLDNAFKAAGAGMPEAVQATAWNAGLLAVNALRKLGPDATAAQVREFISGLNGFTGVNGTFDFQNSPQRGINWKSSVIMVRWDLARERFVAVSPIGG